MTKYLFKCSTCKTVMTIETDLSKDKIHQAPPCPCGISRMLNMSSYEYAYGDMELPQYRNRKKNGWE